ncbi:MAG: D-2-hydroxyacid dehydrogenase [Acidobacteria bacterium]|jgi:phosphoglycerate dehydrogenase-like enzyme|nr:D-2-hydroxyacid dehydrogenase [Acidobacteriota bacterium]
MDKKNYKIWCNNSFNSAQSAERELLKCGTGKHELYLFEPDENGSSGESKRVLLESGIGFGLPDADTLLNCKNLRWVQINSAGYADYDCEDLKRHFKKNGIILTNSSAVYDEPCAEHLLAMILSFARALPFAHDAQRQDQSWQKQKLQPKLQLLAGQTALILGFGAIGRRPAESLKPLKMNLIGIKRTVRGDEPIRVFAESQVDQLLPEANHIINILPANNGTFKFLNAERLGMLKSGAFIYNIGRGSTIDQKALIEELKSGRIAGAYLDVTDPEPLPPENPLWQVPNCFITPHIAGGYMGEKAAQVNHFVNNLRYFEDCENLTDQIL